MVRLSAQKKLELIREILLGKKISDVAQLNNVSRKAIYSWLVRYKNAKGRAKGTALENRYKKNTAHPKYYRNQIVHKILKLITTNPNLGVNQLTIKLNSGRPTVTDTLAGRHPVVTLLKELRLSTRLDRQNFARLYNAPKTPFGIPQAISSSPIL